MSFKEDLDSYIEQSLSEGVLPDPSVILEVEVPGNAEPAYAPSVGPLSAPTPIATFQDGPPAPMFAGAGGINIPPAMFSTQPIAAPPAQFPGAFGGVGSTMEDYELAAREAVLMDLSEMG